MRPSGELRIESWLRFRDLFRNQSHLEAKANQNQWFYNIRHRKPIKTNETPLALQHLEANTNQNQRFDNIWGQKQIKTYGFTTFGKGNLLNPLKNDRQRDPN